MADRLKGKTVLVTGSTTGVGEAVARLCIEEGAQVMVHGLEEEMAVALCDELGRERTGYFVCDVGETKSHF